MSFASEEFLDCKKWIAEQIENGKTWDEVKTFCVSEEEAPDVFDRLQNEELIIPQNMTFSDWAKLVDEMSADYTPLYVPVGISDGHLNNSFTVPTDSGSAWIRYKNYLLGKYDGKPKMTDAAVGFVERNCHWILNHLSRDTRASGPVKGLVMGSVQSGKTANMIGLAAMAAHYDWNMIIILSGSIDNLRKQTRDRFFHDLKKSGGVSWHVLDYTSNPDYFIDIDDKKKYLSDDISLNIFQDGKSDSKWLHRYVMVCLKNSKRLERLIKWLHSNPGKAARMRILVIDDEADQASVNTRKMDGVESEEEIERTAVNQYIIDLVNGRDEEGKTSTAPFQAMNYISFTATPYANVLNEAYESSLYPKNFISSLPESKEYFGAKVIFGSSTDDKYPGLNIVRRIPDIEVKALKGIHDGSAVTLPDEMKKSIAWFLCASAVLRRRGHKKPISMLIHTTALQNGHLSEYETIRDWMVRERTTGSILSLCESVYSEEVQNFTFDDLKNGYPDYGNINKVVADMPTFDEIKDEIELILSGVENILMGEDKELTYHENAVHLCVDNCKANKYAEDGTYLRIVYPTSEQLNNMTKAPVFIVMGGNTLSRGLTIEGLVCTYFARNSNLADTLMQMARWFGYRAGYELLQRIWMPQAVEMKYQLLEKIDEKLKAEFEDFMERGISPSKYGPKILNSALISKFMLTSKNKAQRSIECDFDFSGDSYEVTQFDNDSSVLKENIDSAEKLLCSIGNAHKSTVIGSAYVWENVDVEVIKDVFFSHYTISGHSTLNRDIPIFFEWIKKMNTEEGRYLKWNVAVAGAEKATSKWDVSDISVGKIERSVKKSKLPCLDIGSLRSGSDVLCDVDYPNLTQEQKKLCDDALKHKKNLISKRSDLGLKDIPLLLLYCIDKDGGQDSAAGIKTKINSKEDVIGFSIIIPGESDGSTHAKSVTVQLPE